MRAIFSIASLVIVLCVIAVSVQHQLHASRQFLPSAEAAGASAPFGGASQPNVAQYQRELERTLKEGAAKRATSTDAAETSR
jgi:hypothetical protein